MSNLASFFFIFRKFMSQVGYMIGEIHFPFIYYPMDMPATSALVAKEKKKKTIRLNWAWIIFLKYPYISVYNNYFILSFILQFHISSFH